MEKHITESKKKLLDKYRGCMIGGAVGDALGYAVEFMDEYSIFQHFGKSGIENYETEDGVALISDDTQMSLFTADGLLLGKKCEDMGEHLKNIALSYEDWYRTQTEKHPLKATAHSRLVNFPEIFSRRAPGMTCLSALSDRKKGVRGSIASPPNDSKGCGGVMRVAPIGLYFKNGKSIKEIDMLGAEAAAITHGHDLGYIPAAGLVHIIHLVTHNENITLLEAVQDMIETIQQLFKTPNIETFTSLMKKAVSLSQRNIDDVEAIHSLGEGWVAEETLAIAIYCALKYSNNFKSAIIASINHNGDSDSTGAVTGNILGAYLGLSAIPKQYLQNLELRDIIFELADDLYND
jgi:ADP-ribosylglycohydrolase